VILNAELVLIDVLVLLWWRQFLALPYLPILKELDKVAGNVKLICSIRFAN
jgi:hypothetical protein